MWKDQCLDFVHRQMFLNNTTFRKLGLFSSSGKIMGAPTLLRPLGIASLKHWASLKRWAKPNRVGALIILPKDGNKSGFRNVVFF
jgi:hypothetical protein